MMPESPSRVKRSLDNLLQAVAILGLAIVFAIAYGIVHDQFTTRICIEYFTIAHPKIIESTSPTALAFAWGVAATWWVGAIMGALLACCARSGPEPRLSARHLLRPMLVFVGLTAGAASTAGIGTYLLAAADVVRLGGEWAQVLPPTIHDRFLTAWLMHNTSYSVAALGGLGLCGYTVARRVRAARLPGRTSPLSQPD